MKIWRERERGQKRELGKEREKERKTERERERDRAEENLRKTRRVSLISVGKPHDEVSYKHH